MQPQAVARSVQFVSPTHEPQLVTIIVDTGTSWDCFDVPRSGTGQAILSCLGRLYPGTEFRLGSHPVLALRHGDVVSACRDVLVRPLVGLVRLPSVRFESGSTGLEEIAVSAADLGLLRLRIPAGASQAGILSALTCLLGRQRCLGLVLHEVPVPGSSLRLFCLPRRGRSTLTAVLSDKEALEGALFVSTADAAQEAVLPCTALHTAEDGLGSFWADVCQRSPEYVELKVSTTEANGAQYPVRRVVLSIDYCRAESFGWRPVLEPGPALFDLVANPPGPSIDWYLGRTSSVSVASTQTLPAHWPLPASPLYAEGLPIRTRPVGCALAPGMFPAGTLHNLDCPHYGVQCYIPCVPGYKLWAIRIGQ